MQGRRLDPDTLRECRPAGPRLKYAVVAGAVSPDGTRLASGTFSEQRGFVWDTGESEARLSP